MSYLYHCRPRKMGSRHYIGKRHIFVCRRDCRDATVRCCWGNSSFFAYPFLAWGGKIIYFHKQLSLAQHLNDTPRKCKVLFRLGRTPFRSADFSISSPQSSTATAVAPYPPPLRKKLATLFLWYWLLIGRHVPSGIGFRGICFIAE